MKLDRILRLHPDTPVITAALLAATLGGRLRYNPDLNRVAIITTKEHQHEPDTRTTRAP